jgi:PPM family protein phosphatase
VTPGGSALGAAGEGDRRTRPSVVGGRSHVGLERLVNEDAVAFAASSDHGTPRAVAVVCDGIAAGAGGDRAAAAAAGAALAELAASGGETGERALRRAVAAAHRAVCEAAIERPRDRDEPGTTFVAAVARGTAVDVAWVGDSRAYLIPPAGPATQLTRDHSWVTRVVDSGELTEEEARASKWAQVITKCVGPAEDRDPLHPPEPSLVSLTAAPGSRLVLCSDGLWGVFDGSGALEAAVRSAPEPDDAAAVSAWLVDRAVAAGAPDDVTVAVVLL